MEIVTAPVMSSGADAASFVKELQLLLRTIKTCDGNMEGERYPVSFVYSSTHTRALCVQIPPTPVSSVYRFHPHLCPLCTGSTHTCVLCVQVSPTPVSFVYSFTHTCALCVQVSPTPVSFVYSFTPTRALCVQVPSTPVSFMYRFQPVKYMYILFLYM